MLDLVMAREDVQTNIRLPAELKDLLLEAAAASGRSLSGEVVFRLSQSFKMDEASSSLARSARHIDENAELLNRNMARVEEGIATLEQLRTSLELRLAEAQQLIDSHKRK